MERFSITASSSHYYNCLRAASGPQHTHSSVMLREISVLHWFRGGLLSSRKIQRTRGNIHNLTDMLLYAIILGRYLHSNFCFLNTFIIILIEVQKHVFHIYCKIAASVACYKYPRGHNHLTANKFTKQAQTQNSRKQKTKNRTQQRYAMWLHFS